MEFIIMNFELYVPNKQNNKVEGHHMPKAGGNGWSVDEAHCHVIIARKNRNKLNESHHLPKTRGLVGEVWMNFIIVIYLHTF